MGSVHVKLINVVAGHCGAWFTVKCSCDVMVFPLVILTQYPAPAFSSQLDLALSTSPWIRALCEANNRLVRLVEKSY